MQDQLDLPELEDAARRHPSVWRLSAEVRQTGREGIAMARRELRRTRDHAAQSPSHHHGDAHSDAHLDAHSDAA